MSTKNGTAESVLAKAKREIEIRKKAQPDAKGAEAKPNPSNELNDFDNKDEQPDEEVDPEIAAIMEKIKPVHDYKKKRNYSKIVVGYDSFLLTLDKKTIGFLDTKPSCLDGLTPEEEEDLRFLGVELIETIVHLLKLPMIVGETASIFFQRFYGLKSFVKHPFDHVVMACVLLATKIEETPRRPREIITVFDMLKKKYNQRENKSIKIDVLKIDVKYVMLKNNVVAAERRILGALGFVCQIKHPHGYIFVYLKTLKLMNDGDNVILNTAWAFMNDCMRTDLFLRYFPKTIAAACVVRTCRNSNPEIILPETDGFQWYEVYGVSSRDVEYIITILDRMYERKVAPNWTKLLESVAEARRKKFGIEKVEDITEEEAKKSINAEEEESKKKQNGKDSTYAKKLNASPRKDIAVKPRRERSKSKERYDSRKYNNDRRDRSGRDGRDDRNRRDDRDRKDRERDRKDRDRYGNSGRRRSRSRSKDRRDRDRTSHRDRSRQKEVDKILKQRRRSRSRSPQRGRSQKV